MAHGDKPAELNEVTGLVLASAFSVHNALGPGLLERVYSLCLEHELRKRGLRVLKEVSAPVVYDGLAIRTGYRMDLVVNERVVIEVKAVETLHPVHFTQLLTYLKLSGAEIGLLLNFHAVHLKDGIHRLVA